ncbi:MAG: LamG-like jellyroll fold domain-containing protein [Chthoniobacterales bacterium]
MSIEFWYQPQTDILTGAPTVSYFFDKKYSTNNGISLALSNTGALYLQMGNGTTSSNLLGSTLTWDSGTWYNIAVTYENIAGDGAGATYGFHLANVEKPSKFFRRT